jgi:hypothetical protein
MPCTYWDGIAVCPFYQGINLKMNEIICEGFGSSAATKRIFKTRSEFTAQIEYQCADMNRFQQCPIAHILLEQYEGGNE